MQSEGPEQGLEQQQGADLRGGLEKGTGTKAKLELMAALVQRDES